MGLSAARAYLGFGLSLIAVYFAVGGSLGIYQSLGLASCGAIVIGTAVHRPPNWRGWVLIGASQGLFAAGDAVYRMLAPLSFPALPDAFYLVGLAALILGLILLMGRDFAWRDLGTHVDALLVMTAIGVGGWMLFLDGTDNLAFSRAKLVAAAYPIAELVCIGLMIRIALAPGRRNGAWWLLFAGLALLFVSDGSYVLPALRASYHPGSWPDAGWLGSYLLLGSAALHPSMGAIARSVESGTAPSLPLRRVVVGGAALLMIPVSMGIEALVRGSIDTPLVVIAGSVIVAGMVVRVATLVRELDLLRLRAEESERKFRLVFERSPLGISVGRNGIMSETNPALHRMLGYTGAEFARMNYLDVTHPDDRQLDAQAELDAGTRDAFSVDKRYVTKDGRTISTHVSIALDLEDGLGISVIEDVTKRSELEEQLIQAQKMEAIGKLAGGIAHDFNNLMTAVIGYSDLLLRRADENSREKLEAIRDSAVRASDLTRQLLAFSRRQVLQADELDLRDVVRRMDSLLQRLIGEDVRLATVFGSEPVLVRADPTQLEQVVMNLAVNARDAMPHGGTLTVAVLSDGDTALLVVSDNGVGMDEETAARMFEPFFTTKSLAESSGLGLSTVHGIVGQSGGSILVDSEPGHGTTFTIRLPQAGRERLPQSPAPATLVD